MSPIANAVLAIAFAACFSAFVWVLGACYGMDKKIRGEWIFWLCASALMAISFLGYLLGQAMEVSK